METFRVRRMKLVLLVSSLVFLSFLLLAAFEENFTAEWRGHQSAYAGLLNEQAERDGKEPTDFQLGVKQLYLEGLARVDRCVTCHVGIDNPTFVAAAAPLTAHPGDLLKHHPSDKFGCTICHQGQGRATDKADAHGRISHWPDPMLRGELVYTSCSRCHYEHDLYGGQSDLYGQVSAIEQISQGELAAALPGAGNISRGKKLVVQQGCLGCHKYRGRGGKLGPDITYVGEKKKHDYDFKHIHGDHTVENWLFTHFKSPAAVVPNTLMPELDLSDQQARDLTGYMISLKRKSAPAAYTPLPQPVDATPVRGETLYAAYCSACHGVDGVGAIVRDPRAAELVDHPRELMTPSLRNVDTLGVSSDAYMHEIIASGRLGTSMPAWATEGLTHDEINLLVGFIRRWEPREADTSLVSASRGEARYGGSLYRANCAGCHGMDGRGGQIGISLRSPAFLSIASDEFLTRTILRGRANTAMPSWRQFDNREMSDLLAFIRSWQPLNSDRDDVLSLLHPLRTPPTDTAPVNTLRNRQAYKPSAKIGRVLYRSRCAVCHGDDGLGDIGPSLHNDSVLRVVSNEFLHDTIVRGRPGTAMPAWRQLTSADVADLIALLRSWQQQPPRTLPPTPISGDWQNGELLYRGMCSSCHGTHGEGSVGPQLINPVFLDTVTNATLVEWISHGRAGTQMRPFLRGKHGAAALSRSQIEDIVTFLRTQRGQRPVDGQRLGLGFAPRGKVLFERMCLSCHGPRGEGATGPGIRNPAFLAAASDGFLRATIVLGRDGTEMRSLAHRGSGIAELRADQIDDVIAFIRGNEDTTPISHRFVVGANLDRGKTLYAGFCAGCHGEQGKGNFAPELNNAGFLRAATDGYLQATIIRGRRGTAMRSFGIGSHGLANLTQDEINDIVAHIRQWSPDTRPLQRTEPFPSTAGGE
ncbi:MAG: c-type cytochrome [Pirellulaceae bacterium]|jgi:mono/diheme cytochrome c family protein|nr:c-type cytochrome [Pirellulaceae bacterium]MDP7016493.1 c-type cytochrome [Pirellulaceae bacterium]